MAITVGKLFGNATILYQMKLLAGRKGLNNLVEWVHIIEIYLPHHLDYYHLV